jgi:2-hydroxy-6-oxonona-2,4-dienedioate hydrolase
MSTAIDAVTTQRPPLWIELLGAEVRTYDAGGIPTRSIQAGRGHPVIMLHGVGGHAEAFARNVVPLGTDFDARALDYYGHGLTGHGSLPFSKDAYVKHLIAYMDAAGIKKAHLIGESLGGWIAMWTAIEHPNRVGKVIYTVGAHLNVPIDEETRAKTKIGTDELKRLSLQFVKEPTKANVHARLKWLFHKPERDITPELIELRWSLYQRSLNKPSPAASIGDVTHELTPEVLARVSVPVLFLWTDHNPSQQVATAKKAMTYVPNAEWALIEDAGHWPQWEHPETFNRIVSEYLKR